MKALRSGYLQRAGFPGSIRWRTDVPPSVMKMNNETWSAERPRRRAEALGQAQAKPAAPAPAGRTGGLCRTKPSPSGPRRSRLPVFLLNVHKPAAMRYEARRRGLTSRPRRRPLPNEAEPFRAKAGRTVCVLYSSILAHPAHVARSPNSAARGRKRNEMVHASQPHLCR